MTRRRIGHTRFSRMTQTVKSRDAGVGLASCRNEWEWPVACGTPDIGKLAGVPELASIAEKIADRLQPVIVTDVWRTSRLHTLPGGAEAEASLDIGSIISGALSEPICEHAAVQDAVCGPQFTRLILDLALWAETRATAPQDSGARRLAKIAPALLDKFAAKANRAGRHPGRLSAVALHDFRKALDRLNAAIRFLGSTYPASAVAAYRQRSDVVRGIIGVANDAEVTKALALELGADGSPAVAASATALTTWAKKRQADALTGLKQAARKFRNEPAFWRN